MVLTLICNSEMASPARGVFNHYCPPRRLFFRFRVEDLTSCWSKILPQLPPKGTRHKHPHISLKRALLDRLSLSPSLSLYIYVNLNKYILMYINKYININISICISNIYIYIHIFMSHAYTNETSAMEAQSRQCQKC